jgi:hypothetical protein
MKVTSSFNNYLVIDDFFDEGELKNIFLELDFLTREDIMISPEYSNGARDPQTKTILKKNNVLNDYFDTSLNFDCEHRSFHLEAIHKNNAKIRISSDILFK